MSRGFPSMTALLGLLAVAGYQNRDKLMEMFGSGQNAPTPQGAQPGSVPQTGLPGGLGGGLAGGLAGGLGGLLSSLGGGGAGNVLTGGLNDLVDRFRQTGKGDVADSWVGHGPNQEIAPTDLRDAIGPDVLDTLAKSTGLSHDELLARLSTTLPGAVDKYTPDGRIPS